MLGIKISGLLRNACAPERLERGMGSCCVVLLCVVRVGTGREFGARDGGHPDDGLFDRPRRS